MVSWRESTSRAREPAEPGASSFDLAHVLAHGGVCLVRVPKGGLGEETARLLGSFVVAKTWQAATARASQRVRRDAALYVDGCHNFLTLPRSFDDMLAEARGYLPRARPPAPRPTPQESA